MSSLSVAFTSPLVRSVERGALGLVITIFRSFEPFYILAMSLVFLHEESTKTDMK